MAAALWGGVNSAWAATIETLGATTGENIGWGYNNTSYTLAPNKTLTLEFTVENTTKAGNWAGWITQIKEGNTEYLFMQPCCYGVTNGDWVNEQSTTNYTGDDKWYLCNLNTYEWTTGAGTDEDPYVNNFIENLIGATVTLKVKRIDATVYLITDLTTSAERGSKKFHHYFAMNCGDGTQDLTIVLGADQAVLKNITDTTADTESIVGQQVGDRNRLTAWWTQFSDYYTLAPEQTLKLRFKNYTTGISNWNNWAVAICNDHDRDTQENGYNEYLLLRSDL